MSDTLVITIDVLEALAVILLGAGLIYVGRAMYRIHRTLDHLDRALQSIGRDARPALDRARAVGENLNFLVMSVRKEVEHASETMSLANERLEEALAAAEERVQELGALIDVVQGEVEDTVITATSALRGIRAGARVLRRGRGDAKGSREDTKE